MLILYILHTILFIWATASVIYVAVFAVAACLEDTGYPLSESTDKPVRLTIIYPAYAEDNVIASSIKAILPEVSCTPHKVIVVSDHMKDETNETLSRMPITLLVADYSPSSKARALQLAAQHISSDTTHVVILDADNMVQPGFIDQMCIAAKLGGDHEVQQCHRCALNLDTPTARLDAVSEEINNSVFRRGHNALGISAALIGSGMCFPAEWFFSHVGKLSTSGEDKEFEAMLLKEGMKVRFLDDIRVLDHKVQSSGGFAGQRRRWMAAQVNTFVTMSPKVPNALLHRRWDFIDKWLQQALLPRSVLLLICTAMTLLRPIVWGGTLLILIIALLLAVPRNLYTRRLLIDILHVPLLAFIMLLSVFHLRGQSKIFSHTKH